MTVNTNRAATVPAAVRTKAQRKISQTSFALVGTGWRSSVFLRMAYLMPERFRVSGVMARRPDSAAAVQRDWGVPTCHTIDLSDDDVGVAVLLDQMGAWTRNESPPPYSLAEACHDHAIGLAIGEASESGKTVQVGDQPWR
jgi:predicted dehydrogenase